MNKSSSWQFDNPIVQMDRDGNGYCRIKELWEKMAYGQSITEGNKAPVGEARFPSSKRIKRGAWSEWERQELKRCLNEGLDIQSIADRLNRSPVGVRCNIRWLKIHEAKAAGKKGKQKAG